jgi:hypothetical protein
MSTMETRAPAAPSKLWSLPHTVISGIAAYAKDMAAAIAEAQRMAREAERRYPMSYDW